MTALWSWRAGWALAIGGFGMIWSFDAGWPHGVGYAVVVLGALVLARAARLIDEEEKRWEKEEAERDEAICAALAEDPAALQSAAPSEKG